MQNRGQLKDGSAILQPKPAVFDSKISQNTSELLQSGVLSLGPFSSAWIYNLINDSLSSPLTTVSMFLKAANME